MSNKGFTDGSSIKTQNDINMTEKPLKSKVSRQNRVDINVLKSKLQEIESKKFKKNIYVLSTLILALGALGIYLSL